MEIHFNDNEQPRTNCTQIARSIVESIVKHNNFGN